MSKPAIEIKGLSKAYMIGHEREAIAGTMTFRDSLGNMARKPLELITGHQLKKEKFWALKDVNLDIEQGDVVGIIGRNGSGKSTLLKVLSRIVEPTSGEVIMRGRVASLLEVGTGFHPELTGRENVYFNGAILGMTRKEIQSKFDEIVAFSEVEKFLDTPVKYYSSGMYVRLAFAVAAHLDPDILIVDEVLAVGDAAFQKKCLGKMKDVAGQGRTVLFVSHSMASVRSLCSKGVMLKGGKVVKIGSMDAVISSYMNNVMGLSGSSDREVDIPSEKMIINKYIINGVKAEENPEIISGQGLKIVSHYKAEKKGQDLCIAYGLRNQSDGTYVVFSHNHLEGVKHKTLNFGKIETQFNLPKLSPGTYTLDTQVWIDGKHRVQEQEICDVQIIATPSFGSNVTLDSFPSVLMVASDWRFMKDENSSKL